MENFDKFLKDNDLQKKEIADYLHVSRAFVTQLVQGRCKLSADKLKLIKENKEWDTSALSMQDGNNGIMINARDIPGTVNQDNRQHYSDSPDVLRAQIDKLDLIITEKEERIKEKDAQIKEKDAQIKALLDILRK